MGGVEPVGCGVAHMRVLGYWRRFWCVLWWLRLAFYAARVCWRIGGHVLEGGRGCTPHTLFMGLVVGVVHCTGLVGGLLRTSAQLVL